MHKKSHSPRASLLHDIAHEEKYSNCQVQMIRRCSSLSTSLCHLFQKWKPTIKMEQVAYTLTWHGCILEWQTQKQDCKQNSLPTFHTFLYTRTWQTCKLMEELINSHYAIHNHMWKFCELTYFLIYTLLCISLTLAHSLMHISHLRAHLHFTFTIESFHNTSPCTLVSSHVKYTLHSLHTDTHPSAVGTHAFPI